MRICFFVYAPQKGLLCGIAKELETRGHEPVFLARDGGVAEVIRHHFPRIGPERLVVLSELSLPPVADLLQECLRRERKYGETFATLVSQDRTLGKGYLLNAPGYPDSLRAWWGRERKYADVLTHFRRYEAVLDALVPDMAVGVALPRTAHLICQSRNIPVRILTPPRFGNLYRWTVDDTEQCPLLTRALSRRVDEFAAASELPRTELEQTGFAQYFFAKYRYDYSSAIKKALHRLVMESYQLCRGTHWRCAGGIRFLGWNRAILRKPYIYRYFLCHGVRPDGLTGSRVVLFPLHVEPEASLLNLSSEMNNSMELIAWVSKTLPADAVLVVKEHPDSFGLRPRSYYDDLRRMANVVVAHPHVSGREWINRCNLVANIASTMGFEAVAMEKPVLSFGAHQVINGLPTVVFADSFRATREGVRFLLDDSGDRQRLLGVSRAALDAAFKDVCFDLSGYEAVFKSTSLHMDMARTALDNLAREFPALASSSGGGQAV